MKSLSIKKKVEHFLCLNVGLIVSSEQLEDVVRYETGRVPANWRQRITELRIDDGYTIHAHKDDRSIKVGEYRLVSLEKRPGTGRRVKPSKSTWQAVLERDSFQCQFREDGRFCGLRDGDYDPIGGGVVHLTPDHKTPHSIACYTDPDDPNAWGTLCGRHQVTKRNFWSDDGSINIIAILQHAGRDIRIKALKFLQLIELGT